MYSVYKHTNLENNKVYIGITGRPVEQRWGNGYAYKNNREFYKDIIQQGWDNFNHEVICTCDTYEQAIALETKYIRENLNNCYNISNTACTVPMHSKRSTERSAQPTVQQLTIIDSIPIVEKPKGRRSCPVSQYSVDGTLLKVFPSAKIASEETGINHGSITSCCKGGRATGLPQKVAGGYVWRYNVDVLNEHPDNPCAKKKVYKLDKNHKLICTYDSAIKAALENDISYNSMLYICSGRAKSQFAFGYYWRYEE